jgi:hypothetical protein
MTGFNLGGQYDLTGDYHLLFSAGRGLANADTSNRFSAYLALQVNYRLRNYQVRRTSFVM